MGTPGYNSSIERIDFANDLATAVVRSPAFGQTTKKAFGAFGNANYGWFGGGYTGGPYFSSVARITYASDTTVETFNTFKLASAKTGPFGSSNYVKTLSQFNVPQYYKGAIAYVQPTFGWVGGGNTIAPSAFATTAMNRIDFSNDSVTSGIGSLSIARGAMGTTGNSNYGWFAAGWYNSAGTPIGYSTVDRLDFANYTTNMSTRGPMSHSGGQNVGGSGNANYGWFTSGYSPTALFTTTVQRIDYANDASTAIVRSNIPYNASYSGLGTRFFGYHRGTNTNIFRIDYSADTVNPTIPSFVPTASAYAAGTGNLNYGWWGGGQSTVTTVVRIDFSSDFAAARVRGSLSLPTYSGTAVGNYIYGYWSGGLGQQPFYVSWSSRLDFSNDTATASAVQFQLIDSPGGTQNRDWAA